MFSYAVDASSTALNGLIKNFGLTGKTSASSTNGADKRTFAPINFSDSDRWCSKGSIDIYKPNTWKIIFNKRVFITNYSIRTNLKYSYQFKWIAKGKTRKGWKNISIIESQSLGIDIIETWPTTNHGPFSAFEITTTKNGLEEGDNYYYFCFHKIEFYGFIAPFSFFETCALRRRKINDVLLCVILLVS